MNTLDAVLLLCSVVCLVLAGITYRHRRTGRIRWEWLGIAFLVATFFFDKLAALGVG